MRLFKRAPAPNAVLGGLIVASVLLVALLGTFWTPHDPMALNFSVKLAPPSAALGAGARLNSLIVR